MHEFFTIGNTFFSLSPAIKYRAKSKTNEKLAQKLETIDTISFYFAYTKEWIYKPQKHVSKYQNILSFFTVWEKSKNGFTFR